MKILLASATLLLSTLAMASGTKEKTTVTYQTVHNFHMEFGNVENVTWSKADNNMTKAEFVKDDEPMTAYFDSDGKFFASTQDMEFQDLSKQLQKAVAEKVPGANITHVFQMTSRDEQCYFIETSLNGQKKVWKGNSFGRLTRHFVEQ